MRHHGQFSAAIIYNPQLILHTHSPFSIQVAIQCNIDVPSCTSR